MAKNIFALLEIRDNSVHFLNSSFELSKTIQELGTAALKNFVSVCKDWFPDEAILQKYNFYLMPLAFVRDITEADALPLSESDDDQGRFLRYIKKEAVEASNDPKAKYAFALDIEIRFKKGKGIDSLPIMITNDPNAPMVQLSDSEWKARFPHAYRPLLATLRKRYVNFKVSLFDSHLREFKKNPKLCYQRYPDPDNKKGVPKYWYASGIIESFDQIFSKK